MKPPPTRVLVVDDRALQRKILREALNGVPEVETVGTAANGELALAQVARLRPNLVLLDVEMPVMDGPTTLRELRKRHPEVTVVMVSGSSARARDTTVQALEDGAFDFIQKPSGGSFDQNLAALTESLKGTISLAREQRVPPPARGPTRPAAPSRPAPSRAATIVPRKGRPPTSLSMAVIGSSTGGPAALARVLPELPGNFPLPIVLVQHMPAGFTKSFAEQLNRKCALLVKEAEDGDAIRPGTMIVAAGGQHLVAESYEGALRVRLTKDPPVKSCRPSVDMFLQSLTTMQLAPVLTVILTGMGDDGADGVASLTDLGSYNLVQDAETSVVFGMPGAVAKRGLAHEILPLPRLPGRITEIVRGSGVGR